ncbi:MAG TPA: phosphoglucosamine mutase [Actinomycetota bacterium]|nr:phosphoglucosamine mutase [Actinomycetota bacterium]
MTRLFGTDGIRGVANRDLTAEIALLLGRAAGRVLASDGKPVVVGRDTRISGPMLQAALVAGLNSAGVDALMTGVLPTPGIAWLTRADGAAAGAAISASHNPVEDNGVKFFDAEGFKIPIDVEDAIESAMQDESADLPVGAAIGSAQPARDAHGRYIEHLASTVDSLAGLRVVLDSAHGAASGVASEAFRSAGAEVAEIHGEPDGSKINVASGSTDPSALSDAVSEKGADLGLAFDGDADRVIAVDEGGAVIDGDAIVGIVALALQARGELPDNKIVCTVMSNLGFLNAMAERGIEVITVPVGDRHVAAALRDSGAALGGEQSGHVIFPAYATTGDGILTGLQVASIVAAGKTPLSELAAFYTPYPQVLINVPVARAGVNMDDAAELWEEVRRREQELGDAGRILVRPSGTEPLVRVMVEAQAPEIAQGTAEALADAVRRHLG